MLLFKLMFHICKLYAPPKAYHFFLSATESLPPPILHWNRSITRWWMLIKHIGMTKLVTTKVFVAVEFRFLWLANFTFVYATPSNRIQFQHFPATTSSTFTMNHRDKNNSQRRELFLQTNWKDGVVWCDLGGVAAVGVGREGGRVFVSLTSMTWPGPLRSWSLAF